MSRKSSQPPVSRIEMQVFLTRHGFTWPEFCRIHSINYNTFKNWMSGSEQMPLLTKRIIDTVTGYNYPIQLLTDPDLRLRIEAATA